MEQVDNISDFTHLASNPAVLALAFNGCYYNKDQGLLITVSDSEAGYQQLQLMDAPVEGTMTFSIERVNNPDDISDLTQIQYFTALGAPGQMFLAAIQKLETFYVDSTES